jgi:hypothetical protein
VGALHDEDDVGLVEVVGRDRLLRIGRQAGGGGLDSGAAGEDALGRGGAEAVAGAEEEEVGQRPTSTHDEIPSDKRGGNMRSRIAVTYLLQPRC